MIFLQPFFLLLLPLAALPLILNLYFLANRRKIDFPSLVLLEEVLKQESSAERFTLKLRHLLRFLALAFVVLAFSDPVLASGTEKGSTTIVVDSTVSMRETPWKAALDNTLFRYRDSKVFFGGEPYEQGKERWKIHRESLPALIRGAVSQDRSQPREGIRRLVLLTDGDLSNWKDGMPPIPGYQEVLLLLLEPTNRRDDHGLEVSVLPAFLSGKESMEFSVNTTGVSVRGELTVYLENKKVYQSPFGGSLKFRVAPPAEAVSGARILRGKVELAGKGFTNERLFIETVIDRPVIRINQTNGHWKNIFLSILPDAVFTTGRGKADFTVEKEFPRTESIIPTLVFTDDKTSVTAAILGRERLQVVWKEQILKGDVKSAAFPVLESLRAVEWKTDAEIPTPSARSNMVASIGGKGICYRFGKTYFLPFPSEDRDDPFLLLLVSEIMNREISGNYWYGIPEPGRSYINSDGRDADPETEAGIFREKTGSRWLLNERSDGISPTTPDTRYFKQSLGSAGNWKVKVLSRNETRDFLQKGSRGISLRMVFGIAALLLLLVTVPKQGDSPKG